MDRTPPPPIRREDSDELVITDRELVSRYMRYSENLGETEVDPPAVPSEPQFSSPVSIGSDEGIGDFSGISNSTTKTTPLRRDMLQMIHPIRPTIFTEFERTLEDAVLPTSTTDYYTWQARRILQIGSTVFPAYGDDVLEEDVIELPGLFESLVSAFECSYKKVDVQVQNIAYIQTLAPFTVTPTPVHMWVIYKQMTDLVIRHTSIPSKGELMVLDSLARVYDAYVYQPAGTVQQITMDGHDIKPWLHAVYDKLMSLLAKYQEWCRAMRDLSKNHMRPALQIIVELPEVMGEVIEFEVVKEAAEKAICNPSNPGMQPPSKEVVQFLSSNIRKKEAKSKNRFRREHTV